MMRRRAHPWARAIALPMVLGWVLGGCGHAPVGTARATAPRTGEPARQEPLPLPEAKALDAIQPGVSVRVLSPTVTVVGNQGARQAIDAVAGGMYVSPDGRLAVSIPPGALDRDASVSFEALSVTPHPGFVPGIRFAADLGGAQIQPDKAITVRARVASDFVERLRAEDPAFTPEGYNLGKDEQGNWFMQMPVRGPSTSSPVALPPPRAWELVEFGHLPFAQAATPPAARRLLTVSPPPMASVLDAPEPTTLEEFEALEARGVFSCDAVGHCMMSQVFDQRPGQVGFDFSPCKVTFRGTTVAPSDPPAMPTGTGKVDAPPVPLPVRVSWMSDDPALDGLPVPGAVVRLRMPTTGDQPRELVADAQGRAQGLAHPGMQVHVLASHPSALSLSPTVTVVVGPALTPCQLRLMKMSPMVRLRVRGLPPKLPENLVVRYTLDGKPGAATTGFVRAASGEVTARFAVHVPTDAPHQFVLNDLGAGCPCQLEAAKHDAQIQRNGIYDFAVGGAELAK